MILPWLLYAVPFIIKEFNLLNLGLKLRWIYIYIYLFMILEIPIFPGQYVILGLWKL